MTDTPDPTASGKPNLRVVGDQLAGAAPKGKRDDGDHGDRGGGKGRRPVRDAGDIYPGCPVHALGVNGDTFYYLDYLGQLAAVANHTKDRMRGIFGGRSELLVREFPQRNAKSGKVTGWAQEDAATAMMRAAAEKGVWDAAERVRGLGAWSDQDGGVALHCGDGILVRGDWRIPGLIEEHVYPSAPRITRPQPPGEALSAEGAAAVSDLLALLGTWNWQRGDGVDPWLLLGWLGAAGVAGALRWRPMVWVTGDAGTGKSTLLELIQHVLGGEQAVLSSSDPTEAGIRQVLASGAQATIPVLLDEMEAEENNQRTYGLIKLARQASSGAIILRGGNDHRSHTFKVRSCFFFSSILVPPLLDQDISRIALLELHELDRDVKAPAIQPKVWAAAGRALAGRVLAQWGRWAETLDAYRRALSGAGHSARGCDQYGVLLAAADLAMHEGPVDLDRCDAWAARLPVAVVAVQTDQMRDYERMLNHMLGQQIEPFRSGQRYPLSRWIASAAGVREDSPLPGDARSALPMYGLRVEGRGLDASLLVANTHPGTAGVFEGTRWQASAGQRGVWAQAMKRIPGAEPTGVLSFDGVRSRAYKVPLRAIEGLFGDPDVQNQHDFAPKSDNEINDFA